MRVWGAFLAVLAVAVVARTLPARDHVFVDGGGVRLLGGDAYYHLRHADHVRTDGAVRRWDPWTHYPTGQRATTPGLFDVFVAALPNACAPFVPPALFAVALAALFLLARRLAGSGAALLAAACLAVYPGPLLTRSLLGFLDHHVAEVVLLLLALLGFLRCLDRTEAAEDPPPWWRPALLEALPLALFLFTWSGAPLHLLLLAFAVAGLAVARLLAPDGLGRLPEACARFGLGLFVLAALPPLVAPWLVMRPSLWPLVLGGCAAFAALAAPALALARRLGRPRTAAAVLLVAVAGAFALIASTETGRVLLGVRTRLVAEHKPVTVARAVNLFGAVPLLAAAGLAVAALKVRADGGRRIFVALYAAGLAALWAATRDFGYAAAPLLALVAGFAWFRTPGRPVRAAALAVAAAALLVVPVRPLRWAQSPWPDQSFVERVVVCTDAWTHATSWLRTRTPEPTLEFTAAPEPFDDFAYPEGTYAVWAPWDFANLVSALGQRPVTWSQGAARHPALWLLARTEAEAHARLQAGCRGPERVRYVVLDADTMGDHYLAHLEAAGYDLGRVARRLGAKPVGQATFGDLDRTVAARLYFEAGSGLGRFRLVYATPQRAFLGYVARRTGGGAVIRRRAIHPKALEDRMRLEVLAQRRGVTKLAGFGYVYGGTMESAIRIFECVAGARVRGRTRPGAAVTARLELSAGRGGRFAWERRTKADADGAFELRVPHATAGGRTGVRARGPLALAARPPGGGRPFARGEVAVTERAVQAGAPVEAPALLAGDDE